MKAAPLHTRLLEGIGATSPLAQGTVEDLKVLAKDSATPLETLLSRYAAQPEFEKLSAQLSKTVPREFVDSGYDLDDPGTVWIRFKAEPKADVVSQIRALPGKVRIEWGAPLDDSELELLSERLYQVVRSTGVAAGVVTEVLPSTNSLEVSYKPRGSDSGLDLVAAAVRSTLAATGSNLPTISLRADASVTAGPWFSNDVVRGVHSGVYTSGGAQRSLYTPWTRFSESLSSTLITGSDEE